MSGNIFTLPRIVAIDNGVVVPGAKLIFTATGTSTPQAVYTDKALTTPHSDPVEADAQGLFPVIYMNPSDGDFRVELTDANDVLIWIEDDVPASQAGQNLILTAAAPYIDLIETDASANNGVWRVYVNSEQLKIQVGNDAKDTFVDAVVIDRTANTVDTINLKGTANQSNGLTVLDTAFVTKGSFTPTFTGFSAAPSSPTIYWTKIGTLVFIHMSFGEGTSDATGFTITNWPAAIQSDASIQVPVGGLVDNGTEFSGGCASFSSGSATVSFFKDFDFGLWTGSGNKGIAGTSASSSFVYSTDVI